MRQLANAGRGIAPILFGVIVMTGCATTDSASTRSVTVIAHRGASAYAPENTLAAFALAADMGADFFELDVTLSQDDELIVIHDLSVDRTTNGTGKVREMTAASLKQLDAGAKKDPKYAGEPLPTLRESLELAKERGIKVYIEIKNSADDAKLMRELPMLAGTHQRLLPEHGDEALELVKASGSANYLLTRKTVELVREMNMEKEIVIQSFSPIVCLCSLILAPELRTEFLGSRNEKRLEEWPMYLLWANLLSAHGHNVSKDTITPELMKRFKLGGRSVAVWTVNDEADMRRLAEMGVDAIITDKPDVCTRVLAEAGYR